MAKRSAWLSWLAADDETTPVAPAVRALQGVGLDVLGAPWVDDVAGHAWVDVATLLGDADAPRDLWIIAGRRADWQTPSVRYALSMTVATLAGAAAQPRLVLVVLDDDPATVDMPPLLRTAVRADGRRPWAAKVVAASFRPPPPSDLPFRLTAIAHRLIGTWLELGPRAGDSWTGALVGTAAPAKIVAHAVGPAGRLPESCTLAYPIRKIVGEIDGESYILWSVMNALDADHSYFVRLEGMPTAVVVGSDAGTDEPEVAVVRLA